MLQDPQVLTGTLKHRVEVKRREVFDREGVVVSMFRLIRRVADLCLRRRLL